MAGFSATMQQAIEQIQQGNWGEAERLMVDAVSQADLDFGPDDARTSEMYHELGLVLLQLQQPDRAVQAFEHACTAPMPEDNDARRERLTAYLNWGQGLIAIGQLDDAERVLQQGVDLRLKFYGREHPGYAFGLEPLADVRLRMGKPIEALESIQEAVNNFWQNGHPRVVTGLALHAECVEANAPGADPFSGLDSIPDELISDLAEAVFQRIGKTDLNLSLAVLRHLLPLLEARFGPTHALVHNTLSYTANLSRDLGDHASRIQAIRHALTIADSLNDQPNGLHALLGLALALSDAGNLGEAEQAYQAALARATALNDPLMISQVARNFGLYLREHDRPTEAEPLLRQAVAAALLSDDPIMLARAQIALGIFLQHHAHLEEARPLLESALSVMEPAHPDALTACSHLDAIINGGDCGCGDMSRAMCEAFRSYVVSRLPADLLGRLEVRLEDNRFQTDVFLDREATPTEVTMLHRAIEHAHQHFREQAMQRD